jgi:hypothetical protein
MTTKMKNSLYLSDIVKSSHKRSAKNVNTSSKDIFFSPIGSKIGKARESISQGQKSFDYAKNKSFLGFFNEETLKQKSYSHDRRFKSLTEEKLALSIRHYSTHSDKSYSFPRIASLVGDLEKDYESLYSSSPKTIETAERLIEKLHSVALMNNLWWYDPLLNISFDNEIVLEWWNQSKKITIYVSEEVIDYIKVWGADIDNEMEDGSISLNEDLTDLWQWIDKDPSS